MSSQKKDLGIQNWQKVEGADQQPPFLFPALPSPPLSVAVPQQFLSPDKVVKTVAMPSTPLYPAQDFVLFLEELIVRRLGHKLDKTNFAT